MPGEIPQVTSTSGLPQTIPPAVLPDMSTTPPVGNSTLDILRQIQSIQNQPLTMGNPLLEIGAALQGFSSGVQGQPNPTFNMLSNMRQQYLGRLLDSAKLNLNIDTARAEDLWKQAGHSLNVASARRGETEVNLGLARERRATSEEASRRSEFERSMDLRLTEFETSMAERTGNMDLWKSSIKRAQKLGLVPEITDKQILELAGDESRRRMFEKDGQWYAAQILGGTITDEIRAKAPDMVALAKTEAGRTALADRWKLSLPENSLYNLVTNRATAHAASIRMDAWGRVEQARKTNQPPDVVDSQIVGLNLDHQGIVNLAYEAQRKGQPLTPQYRDALSYERQRLEAIRTEGDYKETLMFLNNEKLKVLRENPTLATLGTLLDKLEDVVKIMNTSQYFMDIKNQKDREEKLKPFRAMIEQLTKEIQKHMPAPAAEPAAAPARGKTAAEIAAEVAKRNGIPWPKP